MIEKIQRGMLNIHIISIEHLMSACDWLDIDNGICTGKVLFNEAIIDIVNPPTQHDSESKSDDDKMENPPCAVITNKVTSALSTLIVYLEQLFSFPEVTNYVDGVLDMKWD